MDIQILNFVNIDSGHIVPASAPGDDPQWIECIINGAHVIISKDLNKAMGVSWYPDPRAPLGGQSHTMPMGTRITCEFYQGRMREVAKLVAEELANF